MGCKVTMSLVSERQDGPIGDDWKYEVEAKVFNEGLKGKGSISVPKHNLPAGATQDPPGPPEPVVMDGGDCGGTVLVRVHVKATEVDLFISDKGEASVDITMKCPGPGEAAVGIVEHGGHLHACEGVLVPVGQAGDLPAGAAAGHVVDAEGAGDPAESAADPVQQAAQGKSGDVARRDAGHGVQVQALHPSRPAIQQGQAEAGRGLGVGAGGDGVQELQRRDVVRRRFLGPRRGRCRQACGDRACGDPEGDRQVADGFPFRHGIPSLDRSVRVAAILEEFPLCCQRKIGVG